MDKMSSNASIAKDKTKAAYYDTKADATNLKEQTKDAVAEKWDEFKDKAADMQENISTNVEIAKDKTKAAYYNAKADMNTSQLEKKENASH
jgi:hypothetical protein